MLHKKGQQHHHRPGVPFTERMYLPDLRKAPNDSRYKRFSGHRRPILTLNILKGRNQIIRNGVIVAVPHAAARKQLFPLCDIDDPVLACPLVNVPEQKTVNVPQALRREVVKALFIE